jgi:ribosomal protein L31E
MPGIFPASTKAGGNCFAMPDVCLTPAPPAPSPVPVPYPNTGMLNQSKKTSTKVKIAGKAVVTLKSEISRSMGDEAGVNKGVVSGNNMGKVIFKKGSSKVKIQGQAIVHLTSMSAHNGTNANMPAGAQVAPSQTKVKVAP